MHLTTDKSWALRENDDPVTRSVGGAPCGEGVRVRTRGSRRRAWCGSRPAGTTTRLDGGDAAVLGEVAAHSAGAGRGVAGVLGVVSAGLRGQVITRYISPELTGKSALTARGVVSRRMNTAARQVWARFVIDEVKRTRTVDRSVAVILLGALAEHPVWLQLRHRSSRPALGSRSQPPARPLPRASQARESNCPPAPARRRLRPEVGPGLGVLADAERLRFPAAVA